MAAMGSTSPALLAGRRAVLAALLGGCASARHVGPVADPVRDGALLMPDGARLPFRAWLPVGEPASVVLALHGFGDSRDAWELPAPVFAASGVAVYAPDQRGFGETSGRGSWAGTDRLVDDAAAMLAQLRTLYPGRPVFLLGESMGGAVVMALAVRRRPEVAGYVLVAPAVWGRARMNVLLRGGLFLLSHGTPGVMVLDGGPVRVRASDNLAALRRLSRDPLTLHGVRFDTLRGLVDLMDEALAAAPSMPGPALFLYGGRDEVIPPEATVATWRSLPSAGISRAFYPTGHHLLLRDLGRATPIADILAWMREPATTLAAEAAAEVWLAGQSSS